MNINQQAITKAQNGERLSFDEALYLYKHADILDLATWARKAKERHSQKEIYPISALLIAPYVLSLAKMAINEVLS